jgi:LPPG:FO 2-phospho-L-lactate transferase
VVVLAGGFGGARMAHGFALLGDAVELTVVVNTADDLELHGLAVSPDLDTVMYTLAGLAHEERGWGLDGETFHALAMVERYGGPAWFQLGDRDLATHLMRTQALARGETLSAVTARLCAGLGVRQRILPMADAPRRTHIDTAEQGTLLFQEWLVRERARPTALRVWLEGTDTPAADVIPALASADLVVIGPSNPYVSIDPILSLTGVRAALADVPVVAVSPIVGGRAVKGPLGEMIPQLSGASASAAAVCAHYASRWDGLLAGFVVEHGDEPGSATGGEPAFAGVPVLATDTIMSDRAAAERLARAVLAFGARLR